MNLNHNEKLMYIIKQLHGLLETDDISQQRKSQDRLGNIYAANKNFSFSELFVNNIHCEWTSYIHDSSDSSLILYCHGGGYMTGSSLYARGITTKLAQYSKLPVLTFDYRLAPEHPYPAALEDALKVWNHLISSGYHAKDIIISGDSAGGNLALALTLYLKEHEQSLPKYLLLFSPWTNLCQEEQSYTDKSIVDPILTREYLYKASSAYIANEHATSPYISPINADLHDFPPVYIQVGENEILLNDSIKLHEKLLACNVSSHIKIFPHMWHVFQLSPFKTAKDAIKTLFASLDL